MAGAPDDFAHLLERARQGDRHALVQLVGQYESKVRLVARYLLSPSLRPYLDSVDLVQSVHRTLLMGLREDKFEFSTPEHLMALALTLVRRKVARQWRRMQRQQRLESGTASSANLPELLSSLCSPQADPAQAAQLQDQIQHVCEQLDEPDRRLLELRLQGYSPAEVADQIGLNVNAMYVRLSRLRQRLRAAGVLDDFL
jgi:RNA polymerase sigma-70 factor (ECF subfamily)